MWPNMRPTKFLVFEVARLADEVKTPTFWVNLRLVKRATTDKQTHKNHITNLRKLKKQGYVVNKDLKPMRKRKL